MSAHEKTNPQTTQEKLEIHWNRVHEALIKMANGGLFPINGLTAIDALQSLKRLEKNYGIRI